jgi:hypothetical protein
MGRVSFSWMTPQNIHYWNQTKTIIKERIWIQHIENANTGIPDFRNEKAETVFLWPKSCHGEWGKERGWYSFCSKQEVETLLTIKMGKIHATLVHKFRVQKMTNMIIMKIENTWENAGKRLSHKETWYIFTGTDRLIFTFRGNQNMLKQQCVKGTPSISSRWWQSPWLFYLFYSGNIK